MIPIAEPRISSKEIAAVTDVLKSGMIAQGEKVEEFEIAFARFIGTKHAIAVNSGTAALHTSLLAHGIGPGDEVITTPFTFIATANAILFSGAKPVFADIDPLTFNIDPVSIAEKVTDITRAIIPVHLYGQPCEMRAITAIAEKHDLVIIEDACQAHGAEYFEQKAGSFGTGCFSFYPTKNMTTGEGGMITTNDDTIAQKTRIIRNHGQNRRYVHERLGFNYRMTDIAAAIGLCQLEKLGEFNQKRIANAEALTGAIDKMKGLTPPFIAPDRTHVFHQYTVRVTEEFRMSRDDLKNKLQEKRIGTGVYYPIPIHRQPQFLEMGYNHLPLSEKASAEVLSLPVHAGMTLSDLEFVIGSLG